MFSLYTTLAPYSELLDRMVSFFTSRSLDKGLYGDITQKCRNDSVLKQIPNHIDLLNLGFLSKEDFMRYSLQAQWLGAIDPHIVELILDVLSKNNILAKYPIGSMNNIEDIYLVNHNVAKYLIQNDLLKNLIFGFDYIFNKFKNSVFKIIIKKGSNEYLGTGFLYKNPEIEETLLITNKHVIEDADGISVVDNLKNEIPIAKKDVKTDTSNDIALINTDLFEGLELIPNPYLKILEEVITIGYPQIPCSRDAYQVCHTGEINTLVETIFHQQLFIFSSRVSPGASGSPIIDKSGRLVGIVSEELFEKESFDQKGITPYSAGVPAFKVDEFVKKWKEE